ncbi:thioesterase family protein [Aspergillus luchuensis]|uniref:Thioesterase family protein n=1 Tax=Aspergillus kawachii TaxID=1069201 RepID=A0A146FHQ7_ASPKA|nr:thioesterase family protein [Aspergillus luchuensis]
MTALRFVRSLRVTAAKPGLVNFELDIKKEHTVSQNPDTVYLVTDNNQNRLNILHGGTIASMVDLGGSLAVASRGLFATGVSTDLNVGKTLAYTSIKFANTKGEVFARGSHTKFVALAWKDPQNIVEEIKKLESESSSS